MHRRTADGKRPVTCLIALMVSATVLGAAPEDWSQWRGPHRNGVAPALVLPTSWPDQLTRAWEAKVGEGHASPVVSNDRVFVHTRDGEREVASALELATGKLVWRQAYDAPYQMNRAAAGHGKGPKSTPAVGHGHLYTLGISGILSCFDEKDGRVLWRKDFRKEFGSTAPEFGTAMSPLVDGSEVIAHVGGSQGGALAAFEAATGAVKWSWNGDGPGYASPIVTELGGARQVITQTQQHVVGVDRATGKLLWQMQFTTEFEQNIVTPLVYEGLLIISGLSKGTSAVRLQPGQRRWLTEQVWHSSAVSMYMSSPVASDGIIFGFSHRNKGQFFALNARTGATLWMSDGRQTENAALVDVGPSLLALTTEGELLVVAKSRNRFDVLKRFSVGNSSTWAHPVPTANGILVKDQSTLALWRWP